MSTHEEERLRTSHRRSLEQQEDLPPERLGEHGKDRPAPMDKAARLQAERPREQEEGIAPGRRGGEAAPSDRPEGETPHPQDVNEIGEPR